MSIDDPKVEVSNEEVAVSEEASASYDLAHLRLQKGLSIEEVASTLRISEDYVDALEKHDLQRLPEPAFIRGYLRKYAPLLDCDPDGLIAEFDHAIGQDGKQAPYLKEGSDEPMTLRAHRTPSAAMGIGLLALALVGGLSYFAWSSREAAEVDVADILEPAEISETIVHREPLATNTLEAETKDFEPPAEEMPVSQDEVTVEDSEPAEVVSESQPEASSDEPEQAVTPELDDGEVQMIVRFKEDCWIEIRDASERVLVSGLRRAGSHLDLDVLPPVSVRLGNAPGVEEITLNGSPVTVDASSRVASLVLEPTRG